SRGTTSCARRASSLCARCCPPQRASGSLASRSPISTDRPPWSLTTCLSLPARLERSARRRTGNSNDRQDLMAHRAGSADLPLHGGQVPKWLADRMTRLGTVITEAIVHECGRDELLRRLAHPFWFQSFGAVMGMDWHSSGITTSVLGALKRGLTPLS